jgi:protocatechuate 3,4-dioxygenase beta subunit
MDRRTFVGGLTALGVYSSLQTPQKIITPSQVEGPFYPYDEPSIIDTDLVRLRAGDAQALGQVVHLFGTARTWDGNPIANLRVDLWQCDANGRYHHPLDKEARPLDPRFQGYGRARTDRNGQFQFRTIKPVSYSMGQTTRTPHIHLAAFDSRNNVRRLTTQLYIAGEPLNDTDQELSKLLRRQREALIRPWTNGDSIELGALQARYDLVI